MFIHITEKIVSNMEKQNMIQANRRSVYKYGINQMLNMLLNTITFLMIGLFFDMVLETVIFTSAYIPLRIYAGGFHAKTPFKCWIVSALMLLFVLLFIRYMDVNIKFYDFLALIGSIIIFFLSPVEDKNKPLDDVEKVVYKKRCIFVFVIELLIIITLRFFQKNDISICIEITWFALSVMLIAGKIKNGMIAKRKLEEMNE